MKKMNEIRVRYAQDDLSIRLGGLATNLARIASISRNPRNWKVVESLMEESKYFIEWLSADVPIEVLIRLAEMQRQLAFWQSCWQQLYTNFNECETIRAYTKKWSAELLEMSGMLNMK